MSFVMGFAVVLAAAQTTPLPAMPGDEALALFKRICIDPFPDPARFGAAIDAEDETYAFVPALPAPAAGRSGGYTGTRATFAYAAGDWLPRDLPSPQCRMTAQLADTPDHSVLADGLAALLALPAGKTRGKGRVQTEWNVPGAVDKVRYFLTTTRQPTGGYEMQVSILNLRGAR